jgi:Xaa-Pro aminopeptidase
MGEFFIHRTGHGLGLDIHEQPWIQAGNDVLIDEGMVFSIEPGVYVPDRFGIRIEDIVTVTSDGCRTLTGFDHSLIVK